MGLSMVRVLRAVARGVAHAARDARAAWATFMDRMY
jgi:hypothetical protein